MARTQPHSTSLHNTIFPARTIHGVVFVAAAVSYSILAGVACQQPMRPTEPTLSDLGPDRSPDDIWDRTLGVLTEHGFVPDTQDRANGRISTQPTTSRQWHEPWRKDVADKYDIMMASLHTIRRYAIVQFVRESNQWKVDVVVHIQQLSEPEPQITTASSALHGFTGALPDMYGRRTGGRRQWRDIGRDGAMESRLIREIAR